MKNTAIRFFAGSEFSWALEVGDLKNETVMLRPEMMKKMEELSSSADVIERRFTGCELLGDDFTVTERYLRRRDGRWSGSISYENNHSKLYVETIRFPLYKTEIPEEGGKMMVGTAQGWLHNIDRNTADGLQFQVYFTSLQLAAFLSNGKCLYTDCRDSRSYLKQYYWYKSGNTLEYHTINMMPCAPRNRKKGKLPYEVSIAMFDGDWFDATQLYRRWAVTAPRFKRAMERQRKSPQRDVALWLWNRGGADHVIRPAEKITDDLKLPVALDWYWWHNNPYDTDYPEYWPPREGIETFRNAVKRLNDKGIYTQVYTNGMTWDTALEEFKTGGMDSVIMDRDGQPHAVEFNFYTHRKLAYMCGEGKAFQDKLFKVVCHLAESGLPGVYLDMIGFCANFACFNPRHRHAPGGGTYNVRGYHKFVERIRNKYPHLRLSTENCNEMFFDCFDSLIILSPSFERRGARELRTDAVPAFSAVYHGAVTLFGNNALMDGIPPWDPKWPPREKWKNERKWHQECPDQFAFELGRTVNWGMQPTACKVTMDIINNPEFADDYQWILTIARFYYENRQFLYDGRMLNPAGFTCDMHNVRFLQRYLFTTEANMKMVERQRPVILHSIWKAPDGTTGLVMINYTRKEQRGSYRGIEYVIPARSCKCVEL